MHIKSVILDGFKSYPKRTELSAFDPYFNAITGLNGSGKSNILDGICFLLGISNLSNVRASNLTDLIYKCGQAGITKASVTIVFDNSDKISTPVGYQDFDELTITRIVGVNGRNKYLINGCNATSSRIHDLFCSIQLNVNNPHFLIMQGQITRVLNMKSQEILSMVEEATGTKMYECKRKLALDTISKKDLKLKEINRILDEDILPTINKLKEERRSYLDFQKLSRELEHTKRLKCAHDYVKLKERKVKENFNYQEMSKEKDTLEDKTIKLTSQLELVEKDIENVQKQIDKTSGNKYQNSLNNLKKISDKEVKEHADYQFASETLNTLKSKIESTDQSIDKNNDLIKHKTLEYERLSLELAQTKKMKEDLELKLEEAISGLQTVTFGIGSSAHTLGVTERLVEISNKISTYKSNLDSLKKQNTLISSEIEEKQTELTKCPREGEDEKKLNKLKKHLESIENEINSCNFDQNKFDTLATKADTLSTEIKRLNKDLDAFHVKNPSLHFSQTDDKSIFGLFSSLFDVLDPKFITAIESAAGGRLFNVVVDTDDTTKKLIKSGSLKKRITFIALNRVSAAKFNPQILNSARKIVGNDKVWDALSLVSFDEKLKPSFDLVFGNTLVCASPVEAKRLAYDKSIGCKCVTLEGDIFESVGTLTGGSRPSHSVLHKQKEYRILKQNLQQTSLEKSQVDQELSILSGVHEKYNQISKAHQEKLYELNLLTSKIKSNQRFQIMEKLDSLKLKLKEIQSEQVTTQKILQDEQQLFDDLEFKSKNEHKFREEETQKYNETIAQSKSQLHDVSNKCLEIDKCMINLQLEKNEISDDNKKLLKQLEQMSSSVPQHEHNVAELEATLLATRESLVVIEREIEIFKEKLFECNKRVKELNDNKSQISKTIFETKLTIKELNQNLASSKDNVSKINHNMSEMLHENKWIESEERNFNVPGTIYNFSNISEITDKLSWLQTSVKKLSRTINTRAMNMLSEAEDKYNDLLRKKKIVESDRKKIELIIFDLDAKKNEALKASSAKVNVDFSNIFSTLLPGATAKLCLIENKNVLEGLEIKVGFGNTWKDSLNELSGGQRSLVALSLILSLLLFKPAPIYILDEVDAALDISHTQNIGDMLRKHFKQSQFIVVSLKDGMFANANVLFKTKFNNGVSIISRQSRFKDSSHRQNLLDHETIQV